MLALDHQPAVLMVPGLRDAMPDHCRLWLVAGG